MLKITISVFLILIFAHQDVSADSPAYMRIVGADGELWPGSIDGASGVSSIGQLSNKYDIRILAFKHDISVPSDPQSAQPVDKGFTITKSFGSSSPLLYQAQVTGEKLSKVTIAWYRTTASGEQEHYFSAEVEGALVSNIKAHMPNSLEGNALTQHMEDVSFSYQKITWTHEVAGTSASSSWDD